MLVRIARELFWLGRNVSRAEHTCRMLDGALHADLQAGPDDPSGVRFGWGATLLVLGEDVVGERSRDQAVATLTLDGENPASIASCVARAREGARTARDVISAEMWEALNTTHLQLRMREGNTGAPRSPDAMLRYVRERAALFWGLTSRTMLDDEARAFLGAGGRLESADMVLRMLQIAIPASEETATRDGQALALLRAVGGFEAYRRAVPAPPHADPVARFLLFEIAYPDSVAASLKALHDALLVADQQSRSSEPVLRLERLSADLEFRRRAGGSTLAEICHDVGAELAMVDLAIAERYFAGALATPGVVTS
jgi:uncharacterized alpha-E superfamily protein